MAKQIGELKITGTFDDITYYKMDGQYYARMKSSLEGKRVKHDPKFKRTMQSAHRLGRGAQLASQVYRSLPKTEQVYSLFKELKGLAILALKEGKSEAEVIILLQQRVKPPCSTLPVAAGQSSLPKAKQLTLAPALFRLYSRVPQTRHPKGSSALPKAMRLWRIRGTTQAGSKGRKDRCVFDISKLTLGQSLC